MKYLDARDALTSDDLAGQADDNWLYTGGYAEHCAVCRSPLCDDEEERGTCDDCAAKRAYHDRVGDVE